MGPATAAGISAHAFTYPERVPDPVAREAMFARHWTQLQFFRRELLEDLATAEKITLHASYGCSTLRPVAGCSLRCAAMGRRPGNTPGRPMPNIWAAAWGRWRKG
ncbi:hypothetical protein GCM10011504_34190 [Siccirubricoccus deserti]|uniref:Uncharacterized protein n=1 Tax=Siccirubricoccus deserti TaxID=2013562 RepID=A0A9X0UEW5_9PROT|nr:hypothetical protein [Siccirubricoccus deserti]MBC4018102.1 hypothetical protein [Siccirubricoccus deserti]GGC53002.1 hypothetical protein GCM10011504_34190 [Siccirubricoccus deserti]